jgi:hypothetical protein
MTYRIFDGTAAIGFGGFSLGTIIQTWNQELSALVLLLTAIHVSIKIIQSLRRKKPASEE